MKINIIVKYIFVYWMFYVYILNWLKIGIYVLDLR